MPEPVQLKPGLVQRFDLMAVAKPRKVRRAFRFYGVLGFWALIGAVSSLAVQHWKIAAITFATAVFPGFMWWLLLHAPHSRDSQWLEELSNS